jgi:hypothetical protein
MEFDKHGLTAKLSKRLPTSLAPAEDVHFFQDNVCWQKQQQVQDEEEWITPPLSPVSFSVTCG